MDAGDPRSSSASSGSPTTCSARRWPTAGAAAAFLLGDAAHLTPPFIGQGMGAGLRDANNLAWKLAGVIHRALEPTALDSYELERKPHARTMITTAIGIGLAMTAEEPSGKRCEGWCSPEHTSSRASARHRRA